MISIESLIVWRIIALWSAICRLVGLALHEAIARASNARLSRRRHSRHYELMEEREWQHFTITKA